MRLSHKDLNKARELTGKRVFITKYSAERSGEEPGYWLNKPGTLIDDSHYVAAQFDKQITVHDGYRSKIIRFFWIECELDPDNNY